MTTPVPIMPNARVALYELVQFRLAASGEQSTLAEFIMARRVEGEEIPYRKIASELVGLTGIDLTHEAVRRWYHKIVELGVEEAEAAILAAQRSPVPLTLS